jgi:hypothetical protein
MDLTEGEDAYLVRLDMPGLDKSAIDVKVESLLLWRLPQGDSGIPACAGRQRAGRNACPTLPGAAGTVERGPR